MEGGSVGGLKIKIRINTNDIHFTFRVFCKTTRNIVIKFL